MEPINGGKSGPQQARDQLELRVLLLAQELGSVVEACRQLSVDRSIYYRALKRQREARDGRTRSPLAKSVNLENKAIALCLEFPAWGCDRLAWYLTLKGDPVSSPTIQKILIRHGLGRSQQRRALAARLEEEGIKSAFAVP